MLLEDKYYKVTDGKTDDPNGIFRIQLLPDSDVYRGHFPGNPVCPGVCNIEMIKECTARLTGKKLFISSIKQCRLTAIASPSVCPELDIRINAQPSDEGFSVSAKISDAEKVYMEYKGEMRVL